MLLPILQTHAQCSELFYRDQLASDISTSTTASVDERKRMMELLKQFEENNLDDPIEEGSDDDDGAYRNLAGLDFGKSLRVPRLCRALMSCMKIAYLTTNYGGPFPRQNAPSS